MTSKFLPLLFLAIFSLITVHASSESEKYFDMIVPVKIENLKEVTPDKILKTSELGLVYGTRNCAKSGLVQELRTEHCRTEVPAICSLPSKENVKVTIIFVPTENINDYKVRLVAAANDGLPTSVEIPMPGKKLKAGEQYLYTFTVAMKEVLEGKFFYGRAEVIDNLDQQVKACAGADYYVWPKSS